MCSGRSDWALPQPGFPIRRSTDQSLVDSSPWLFAATHVLHRHLAPRHPPLALCNLKSHTPRLFLGMKKSKEPLLSRRSCSLCSSQGSRRNHVLGSRLRYAGVVGTPHGCGLDHELVTPVLPLRGGGHCPLPQNRAVNTRSFRISVVSATARSLDRTESGELLAGAPRSRGTEVPSNQCST